MSRSNVVYFGSIPYNWDVETIKSVVCGTGRVVDVRCMMELPNKNKGFCFIEYATPEDALDALPLLSLIKVLGSKKLRVELSKEGLRSSASMSKPVLTLNRNLLPSNVILPDEVLRNGPPPTSSQYGQQQSQTTGGSILDQLPPEFVQLMTTNTQFQQIVTQMINNGVDLQQILEVTKPYLTSVNSGALPNSQGGTPSFQLLPLPYQQQQQQQQQQLPDFLRNASTYLPKEPSNLFISKDSVDSSLKKYDPPTLIQLITNLKEVVDTSNPYNAKQVIKGAPDLAVSSAQLLLLMGFIDADVIQEAMTLAASESELTPAPLIQQQQQQQQQQIDPNWAGLRPHTIERFLKMDKSQADMILQVLKMNPGQISVLPPDQRNMVEQLRSEYL